MPTGDQPGLMLGQEPKKRGTAHPGDTVALGRLESIGTGETLTLDKGKTVEIETPAPPRPVYGLAIAAKERKDEVKMTAAIAKIVEEDRSIRLDHNQDFGEMVLPASGIGPGGSRSKVFEAAIGI